MSTPCRHRTGAAQVDRNPCAAGCVQSAHGEVDRMTQHPTAWRWGWFGSGGAVAATAVVGAAMIASGPNGSTGHGPPTAPTISPPLAKVALLEPFSDCEQVRSWYVDAMLPHVTAWGLEGQYGAMAAAEDAMVAAPLAAAAERQGSDELGRTTGNGATGTNVQEAGVDEPDIAKTNGDIVVSLDRRDLVVTDVTGDRPRELSRLTLPGRAHPKELLLVGDRVVALGSSGYGVLPRPMPLVDRPLPHPRPIGTTITTVDLSDPTRPALAHSERVDGNLVSSREHDSSVRIVVSATPHLPFVTPDYRKFRDLRDTRDFRGFRRGQGWREAERAARAENRRIVRETDLADWLPRHRTMEPGAESEPLLDCGDIRHPKTTSGVGTIAVLTMDPASPESLDSQGVTADGDLVYASTDRLYVSTTTGGWSGWEQGRDAVETTKTEIHAFATEEEETTYVASGKVPGTVLGRWAFSEYDGRLRVATTRGEIWRPTDNAIMVLEERDGELVTVGSVGGMGKRETIRSVRWFGDIAILVTFRQVDPLYTVDLSDPERPRVRGELKIPGFSAYLHPLGDDLLLGVGQDATRRGAQTGSQVSTFDLGDLDDPLRVDQARLGNRDWSPVQDDSRAFTYLPDHRLALVPATRWTRASQRIHAVAIDPDGGLRVAGTLSVSGSVETARTLPIDEDRIALVSRGSVDRIIDVTGLGS
ncbi:MAG: hypothetical protein GEU93_11875 [Propionibacteriales bacterium]|nr:hypothetical protein [Propionibacteriales bacterium]